MRLVNPERLVYIRLPRLFELKETLLFSTVCFMG